MGIRWDGRPLRDNLNCLAPLANRMPEHGDVINFVGPAAARWQGDHTGAAQLTGTCSNEQAMLIDSWGRGLLFGSCEGGGGWCRFSRAPPLGCMQWACSGVCGMSLEDL